MRQEDTEDIEGTEFERAFIQACLTRCRLSNTDQEEKEIIQEFAEACLSDPRCEVGPNGDICPTYCDFALEIELEVQQKWKDIVADLNESSQDNPDNDTPVLDSTKVAQGGAGQTGVTITFGTIALLLVLLLVKSAATSDPVD